MNSLNIPSNKKLALKQALRALKKVLESPKEKIMKKIYEKNTACPETGANLEKRKPAFLP